MNFNLLVVPLIGAGLLILIFSHYIWKSGVTRGEKSFSQLGLAIAFYTLSYVMELSSLTLEWKLFWIRFEYIGIAFIPALFCLSALYYNGKITCLRKPVAAAIFIIPVVTVILANTNEFHNLIYQSAVLNTDGPFPILDFERGPWYWVNSAYIIIGMLISNALFFQLWLSTNRTHRRQIAVVLFGSLVPWIGFLVYLARPIPWLIDINPFFISLSGMIIFGGLLRYGLMNLIPIARTTLFEEMPDGALILDNMMRVVDLNATAQQYLPLNPNPIGKPVSKALAHWPEIAEKIKPSENRYSIEAQVANNSKPTWLLIEAISLQNKSASSYGQMLIIRDITERKTFEKTLYNLTVTDELTRLFNRRYFMQIAAKELNREERYGHTFSLAMIDIDFFKNVNDSFGHSAGDSVLISLGLILKKRLRQADTAARLGGEEFGLILPETTLENAYLLTEDLRKIIADTPVYYEERKIFFTVSVGIAACSPETENVEDLLRAADKALYRAKDEGRNRTIMNPLTAK
ncbi:MAG: histidine kinase N-terminal 7TM domain-containing protein [Bacillota bacterium]